MLFGADVCGFAPCGDDLLLTDGLGGVAMLTDAGPAITCSAPVA